MLKKMLIATVLSLALPFAVTAAETDQYTFDFNYGNGAERFNVTTLEGQIAPMESSSVKESQCQLTHNVFKSTSEFKSQMTNGMSVAVAGFSSTESTVKTYFNITVSRFKDEGETQITPTCALRKGLMETEVVSDLIDIPLGKPHSIKLKNGESLTITATKKSLITLPESKT
ncbi:MAG: hypothetical protein RSD49_07980 [Hafnia sp.]